MQVFPPALLCGSALLNVTLRRLVLSLRGKGEEEDTPSTAGEAPPTNQAKDITVSQRFSSEFKRLYISSGSV